MSVNSITKDFSIFYESNEFPSPEGMIKVSCGDSFILDGLPINILGYGNEENEHALKIFFSSSDDIFAIDVFEFSNNLLEGKISLKRFIDAENNTYFNDRVAIFYDVEELKEFLGNMIGIILRGYSDLSITRKKYDLDFHQIGNPDWKVAFRPRAVGGQFSLAKISALTKEYPGKVFLHCFSTRDVDGFVDSNSRFFILMGVGISPAQCLMSLRELE